jgi:hypothetical protein
MKEYSVSRPPSTRLLPPAALLVTLILTSCASGGSSTPAGGPATQEVDVVADPSPSPEATPATPETPGPTTGPTVPPTSGRPSTGTFSTYTTADGSLSFDHPSDWTVTPGAGPSSGGGTARVATADGRQIATLETGLVTGAECPAELPYSLLDSQPLPALAQAEQVPRFAFEGRMDPSVTDPVRQNTLAYGITAAPEPTGPGACPIAHFFSWPPSGAAFGGTYDPFAVYPGKPMHVDTPEAYMETDEYQDIRSMITSLRPAG